MTPICVIGRESQGLLSDARAANCFCETVPGFC